MVYEPLAYTKTVNSVKRAHADWLDKLRIACAIYLRATRAKWRRGLHRRQVKKSSKLNFLWCILSHGFSIY